MRAWVVTLSVGCALLFFAACGEDDLESYGDTVTGDTTGGNGDAPPIAYDLHGVELPHAVEPDTASPRDPNCGEFDDGVYGEKRPWRGFEYEGQLYTCNACLGGIPSIQGTWRRYSLSEDDPTVEPEDGVAQRFVIDGNTWQIEMRGDDLGSYVESTMGGWYFCADQPENSGRVKVFILESVVPNGAFGWVNGMVWSADTLLGQDNSGDLLLLRYAGVGGESMGQRRFCRIGSTVWGKLCRDPFAN